MGAVTLPYFIEDQKQIAEYVLGNERRLISTIHLQVKNETHLSETLLVLNDEQDVERTKDRNIRNQLLQLHGIGTSLPSSLLREYVMLIFQTKVLIMYCSVTPKAWLSKKQKTVSYQKLSLQDANKEVKRAQCIGVRAVYALGLDYGLVRVGIGAGRKTAVMSVNPEPRMSGEMEEAFINGLVQYIEELESPRPSMDQIILGADPEFVLQSPNGHLLIASNYFPLKGKVGCDAIWLGQNHSNKPLVEIRPSPTPDPKQLVIRIYQSLLYVSKKVGSVPVKWLAGAMPYNGFPLGGHIHFSGIQPNFKMLRALDNYLALPLIAIEDQKGSERRPKYGFLGDFRYQFHGGFEYRTLPSWLISPTLTKGVIAAAKIIVANYKVLGENALGEVSMQEAYYRGNKAEIQRWIPKLWDDLKRLKDYQLYESYLESFYLFLTSGISWDESRDFRKSWRISPYNIRSND